MSLSQRIARRYMTAHSRRASIPDLMWGIDQLEGVATALKDVVLVWEGRSPGMPGGQEQESLADVYGQVAKTSNALKGMIKTLDQQAQTLRNVHSKPIPAVTESKRAAVIKPRRIDPKTKAAVSRAFKKVGLDGNGKFVKAEHGYSKALNILGEVGIEMDELVSSHEFSGTDGSFSIRLAFHGVDAFTPESIVNSKLAVSFHKRSEDNFEVLAYLS